MRAIFKIPKILLLIVTIALFTCGIFEPKHIINLDDISFYILYSPYTNNKFVAPYDSVFFSVLFNSEYPIDFSRLTYVWTSSIDGILHTQNAGTSKKCEYRCTGLSRGTHKISLYVYNEEGDARHTSITLYAWIKLEKPEYTGNKVILTWSTVEKANFQSWEIFRSGSCLDTLYSYDQTSYEDTNVVYGTEYKYQIFVNTPDIQRVGSNIQSIITGGVLVLDGSIAKSIIDRERNMIYSIGCDETSTIPTGVIRKCGLRFIDVNSKRVIKHILEERCFSDLDIDSENKYVYLCSLKDSAITQVDLSTMCLSARIPIAAPGQYIEAGRKGRVYYLPSDYDIIRIVDTDHKHEIDINSIIWTWAYLGDMEASPDGNYLYCVQRYKPDSTFLKIDLSSDSTLPIIKAKKATFRDSLLILSKNNVWLFNADCIMDTAFNTVGYFPSGEPIRAVSPDDSFSLSTERIYRTGDKSVVSTIPVTFNHGMFLNNREVIVISSTGYKTIYYLFRFR